LGGKNGGVNFYEKFLGPITALMGEISIDAAITGEKKTSPEGTRGERRRGLRVNRGRRISGFVRSAAGKKKLEAGGVGGKGDLEEGRS